MTDLDGKARTDQGVLGDERIRRARLQVASHATGVDDCRYLLDILGLLPEPGDQPEGQS
jgi:hypothetical protein